VTNGINPLGRAERTAPARVSPVAAVQLVLAGARFAAEQLFHRG